VSKDKQNSQDLLNDAIREATGEPVTARWAAAPRPAAAAASADLRSVLNDLAGGGVAKRQGTDTSVLGDPNTLRDTLQEQSSSQVPARSNSSPSPSASQSGISDLIREASGISTAARPATSSAKNSHPSGAHLGDVVQDAYTTGINPGAAKDSLSGASLRRLGIASAVGVLLLGSVGLWRWSSTHHSGPSGTLHELAKEAEQYRASHNGQWPKELAALEAFPKDAVEWPLRYWNARDAAGRTEIIWVPQSDSHYRIVLRQGSEVWTVTDREGKPKLAMKGTP
jgi:hypothetical protein